MEITHHTILKHITIRKKENACDLQIIYKMKGALYFVKDASVAQDKRTVSLAAVPH